MSASIYVVATMDTKGAEAAWVAEQILATGLIAHTVDVSAGTETAYLPADIQRERVLAAGGTEASGLSADRGAAVAEMSRCLEQFLITEFAAGRIAGVIGLGGSGGTSLIASAFRSLPAGVPKLIVSTVASGNTSAYIDCSDLVLFPSIVDVAGLNAVSMDILQNAAHAICGMVRYRHPIRTAKPLLGLTMFGVTTPCVMAAKAQLEETGWECLIFHATGTGGRAMEHLVASGKIVGLLDLTTTEVADLVAGGIFPALPTRFDVLSQHRIPAVISFGALDMVNFGPRDTVPARYCDRQFHIHNSQITLMRTTPSENAAAGRFIAEKLNQAMGPLRVLIPEAGISKLDAVDGPFYNPTANRALFDAFKEHFIVSDTHQIRSTPYHINDSQFAQLAVDQFMKIASRDE